MGKYPRARAGIAALVVAALVSAGLLGGPAATGAPNRAVGPAATAATSATNSFNDVPVAGTFGTGVFRGVMDISKFSAGGGRIVAIGKLNGVFRTAAGDVLRRVNDTTVRVPVDLAATADRAQASATCRILRLVLGPLDLNLLGLKVHLNRVVLTITAESGPGQLLGNLLCAIAHLLDDPPLGVLANLLNAVLRAVGIRSMLL